MWKMEMGRIDGEVGRQYWGMGICKENRCRRRAVVEGEPL